MERAIVLVDNIALFVAHLMLFVFLWRVFRAEERDRNQEFKSGSKYRLPSRQGPKNARKRGG